MRKAFNPEVADYISRCQLSERSSVGCEFQLFAATGKTPEPVSEPRGQNVAMSGTSDQSRRINCASVE
jgi:hypothetical protein